MLLSDITISKQNIRENPDEAEEFENLKASIKEDSLIQRIVLRPSKSKGKFEVVAGGRRFRALCALNPESYELKDTDYVLKEEMDDDQALVISIEENTQRLPFSVIELNRAGLALNQKGYKDKDIAKKLNVSPHRLKRILELSADFSKMPAVAKEELGKLPEDSLFTDKHWEHITKKLDDKETIAEVVDFIIKQESPAKEVPSIIKMVEKNRKEAGEILEDDGKKPSKGDAPDESEGPIEYAHKGELVLEETDGKVKLKVMGKGEDDEVPIDQYLNFLRHPEKFKCYVSFKLKIKPVD